jgi:outer membrane protein
MTLKTLIALGALSSLTVASAAWAQAPAPAAASAVGGPPVAGVCTYVGEGALLNSAVGKSTSERLKQLVAAVQAELTPEASAIQAEAKAYQAMSPEQRQQNAQKIGAFQQKVAAFERKQELRNREIEATRNKEFGLIGEAIQPIINQIATEKSCGLLIERTQVYWANPQMDVTEQVIQRLNAKMTALPAFDREHLDQQVAAAPPAAAPSAVKTTTHHKK